MNINYAESTNFKPISAITPLDGYWKNGTWKFNMSEITAGAASQPSWIDVILKGTTALTLVNSKQNGLNYLKLFGGTEQLPETYIDSVTLEGKCEQNGTPTPTVPVDIVCNNGAIKAKRQSGLPLGYQMVEWLIPTGAIVITGFKTKSTQEITTVFYLESSGSAFLYWSDTSSSGTTNTTAYITSGYGNWRWDGRTLTAQVATQREITSVQSSDGLYFNGEKLGSYTNAEEFVSTNDLSLSSNSNTLVRIFSQTIREGDAVTLDLVPVQRLSDSIYGFYDKVSGEFYTNTEATFVAGDVIDDPVEIYTDGTTETVTDSNQLTATAERLLSVGNYKDTQEVLTGVVTRNIGIKVLDGTEDWQLGSSSERPFYLNDSIIGGYALPNTPFCTHLQGVVSTTTSLNMPDLSVRCGYEGYERFLYIKYKDLYSSGINAFKQWLTDQYNAGTPVIIIYPLATTTTETVSGQQLNKEPLTVTGSLTGLVANVVSSTHTTPTPTQPLPINTNNGVLKYGQYGKNLFNQALFNTNVGSTITYATFEIPNGTYTMSTNFPISNNVTNVFIFAGEVTSGATTVTNGVYDEQSRTITVTDGKYTMAYRSTTSSSSNTNNPKDYDFQLELGSTATPYEPYQFGIHTDGTVETVEVAKNYFTREDETVGQIIGSDGTVSNNANYCISAIIELPVGEYKCEWNQGESTSRPFSVYKCNSNGNIIATKDGGQLLYSVSGIGSGSFSIDTDTLVRISYRINITENSYVMLSLGTATAEMLLKVGDYQDVQSVLDGVVTRNVGVKVLDGTENWTASGNLFYAGIATDALEDTHSCYCTHFKGVATNVFANYDNEIKVGTNVTSTINWTRVQIYPVVGTYSGVTALKQWLADQYANGTPVIVIYPLAEPTTETVTPQPLSIQAGTNTVEITQASIDGLPLEVSYKAGVTVTITEVQNAQLDNSVDVTIL